MKLTTRNLVYIPIVLIVGFIAWYFSDIIGYFIIAGVVSLIGTPLVELLSRIEIKGWKIPRFISAILTLLTIFLVFFGILAMFIPLVIREAEILAHIDTNEVLAKLQEPLDNLEAFINSFQGSEETPIVIETYLKTSLANLINIADVTNVLNSIFGVAGNLFVTLFSVTFLSFFFLKDKDSLKNLILVLSPTRYEDSVRRIMHESKQLLSRYFIGIIIQISIIITVLSIGLSIIGVENAILIGFIAGLFNLIPYIGPILGASLGIIIGITTGVTGADFTGILPLVGKMMVVFAIAQLLDNLVLQPLIFSKSVKAHPIEIFVVILVAGSVSGVVGMIVAIPVYTILRIFLREFFAEFKIVKKLTENI